jgi:hypothetical protein
MEWAPSRRFDAASRPRCVTEDVWWRQLHPGRMNFEQSALLQQLAATPQHFFYNAGGSN